MNIEEIDGIALVENKQTLSDVTTKTDFSKTVDKAKINVIEDASVNDKKFVEDFKKELKDATLKSAQLEKEKQELEKQNVKYHQELLETQQKLNKQKQEEDKWTNRQKSRQFHYDGVKDIMICLGIKNPMCIPLLYFMFIFAVPAYLIKCFFKATIGNLLFGAVDENRPQSMKNFLWILLVFVVIIAIITGGYLIVDWLHPFGLLL